jgi:hypothetical protein
VRYLSTSLRALLGERLTIGAVAGLVLIAFGAWLATSRRAPPAGAVRDDGATAARR